MKNETKKSHIVPKHYLARFAGGGEQVWVFDKKSMRTYRANIRDVAQERSFYELSGDVYEDTDPQALERYLSILESDYKACVDLLLNNYQIDAYANSRTSLARYVILQAVRSKEARIKLNHFFAADLDEIIVRETDRMDPSKPISKEWLTFMKGVPDATKQSLFLHPAILQQFAEKLSTFIWCIGTNGHKEHSLYTSDNPVVASRSARHGQRGLGQGLDTYGIEMLLPLSPTAVLWLFEPKCFTSKRGLDGTIIRLTKADVKKSNTLQISNALRQVFSPHDNLGFAKSYCTQFPEVCDLNRFKKYL
ncbi:MAG TPA: DUF4238 domain-containing protein [Capsulimonadaceae bacterium]